MVQGNKGRPKKVRFIQQMPKVIQFSPRGKPGRPDEVELSMDEFEAMKLADYQGFSQEQGAAVVRLSRASFGRILRSARKKMADALVNGKIIKIKMGNAQVGVRKTEFTLESFEEEVVKFRLRNEKVAKDIKSIGRVSRDARSVEVENAGKCSTV